MEDFFDRVLANFKHAVSYSGLTFDDVEENCSYEKVNSYRHSHTAIIFAKHPQAQKSICIKRVEPHTVKLDQKNSTLFEAQSVRDVNAFLKHGFNFSKRMFPNIFVAMAEIAYENDFAIRLGRVSADPVQLDDQAELCIVMSVLPGLSRLEYWLGEWWGDTYEGTFNLGEIIGDTQKKYEICADKTYGTYRSIAEKLELNTNLFNHSLEQYTRLGSVGTDFSKSYHHIPETAMQLMRANKELIAKRHRLGKIKVCHGDLKRKNIYLLAPEMLRLEYRNLVEHTVLIDPIDFNPLLYNIDTLSDAAMLAVDIELYHARRNQQANNDRFNPGYGYLIQFLAGYIRTTGENIAEVASLLEFYMLEKLMVIAYCNILFTPETWLAGTALDTALFHTIHSGSDYIQREVTRQLANCDKPGEIVSRASPNSVR